MPCPGIGKLNTVKMLILHKLSRHTTQSQSNPHQLCVSACINWCMHGYAKTYNLYNNFEIEKDMKSY
jgi:hypothetical protein